MVGKGECTKLGQGGGRKGFLGPWYGYPLPLLYAPCFPGSLKGAWEESPRYFSVFAGLVTVLRAIGPFLPLLFCIWMIFFIMIVIVITIIIIEAII